MKKYWIWLPVALALSGPLLAKDWHVSPKGDDANSGATPAQPFRTLQKAESVVQPGDTVLLGGGIYASAPDADKSHNSALLKVRTSGRADAWITWKARKGEKPELHSRQWSAIEINGSYHVFDGITVTGQNDEVVLLKAIEASKKTVKDAFYNTNGIFIEGRNNPPESKPHHIIVRNCVVSKMPGGGIVAIEADYVTVEDNKVFENAWFMEYGGSGITFLNNWAFDDKPGYHIVVQRNMSWNNKTMVAWEKIGKLSDGNGILLDVSDQDEGGATNPNADASVTQGATNPNGDPVVKQEKKEARPKRPIWRNRALIANNLSAFNGGSGIHTFRTSHVDIINNTTYWNGAVVGYEELFPNRSNDIVILNNIIVPRPGGKVTSNNRNTRITWDYNVYPVDQTIWKGPNDIVADPKFIDPYRDLLRADFRLAKGSVALGSGGGSLPQAVDLAGRKRPTGKGRDRGAYEQ
ncbi:MAG: right-handed parallel beta-helix repeat-containing protein [Pseudomonadota bacterium]